MEGFESREASVMDKLGRVIPCIDFHGITENNKDIHYIAPLYPCNNVGEYALFSDAVRNTYGINGRAPRMIIRHRELYPAIFMRERPSLAVFSVYPKRELIEMLKPGNFIVEISPQDIMAVRYLRRFLSDSK